MINLTTILTHPIALFIGEPINAIVIIGILVNIAVAWRTWISNKKNPINILFALAGIGATIWLITVLGVMHAEDPSWISFSIRAGVAFPVLLALFLNLFSYYFPYKTFVLPKWYLASLVTSSIIIFVIAFLPGSLFPARVMQVDRFQPEANTFLQAVVGIYMLFISILTFRNLIIKYRNTDGVWKKRIQQVLVAITPAVFGSLILTAIVPIYYDHSLEWITSFFSIFLVIYIWYNIFYIPGKSLKEHE